MTDPLSSALLAKAAPYIVGYITEKAKKSLEEHVSALIKNPVANAIKQTSNDFSQYVEIRESLEMWCESPETQVVLASLQAGELVTEAQVITSLAKYIHSVSPDAADRIASEVLPHFLNHLNEAVLGSRGLYVLDRHVEERFANLAEGAQHSQATLSRIEANIAEVSQRLSAPPAYDTTLERSVHDARFETRLDTAKHLLEIVKPNAALSILQEMQADDAISDVSTRLTFRLHGLLGSALVLIERPAEALRHFEVASTLDPKSGRAQANLAALALGEGNVDDAWKRAQTARGLDGDDPFVASVLIRVLAARGEIEDFDAFVHNNAIFLEDPYFLFALAESLCDRRDFSQVVALIQPRLKNEIRFAPLWELLGRGLLVPLQAELRESRPLPWRIPAGMLETIRVAEQAFTNAINLLEETERKEIAGRIRVNRAVARGLLGRGPEAEEDYDRALATDSRLDAAHHAKGILLLNRDDASALNHFKAIRSEDLRKESAGPLALAYVHLGQPRKAIEILEAARVECDPHSPRFLTLSEILLKAYLDLGEQECAETLVEEIRSILPDSPETLCLQAKLNEHKGNEREAREALETALGSSSDRQRHFVAIDLADFYFRHTEYRKAAELYESIIEDEGEPFLRLRLLTSLFNSGQYRKAFDKAVRIREREGVVPGVTDVEVWILERVGDLDAANKLIGELEAQRPNLGGRYRVRMALNEFRRLQDKKARALIKKIAVTEIEDDPMLLMQVAKLRHLLDMPQSMEYMYLALERRKDVPEVQLAYLYLMLARQVTDKELFEPIKAGSGTVVTLINSREERFVEIITNAELENPPNRVRPRSALGSKLVGQVVGAEIEWSNGVTYTIKEIKSRFVVAHQGILSTFEFSFPDHPGLQHVDVSASDPIPLLAVIERRHDYARSAFRLYAERRVSLGGLAGLLNENIIDMWLALTETSSERLLCANGTAEEASDQLETLTNALEVVADQTGLLTLARLGLLDRLPKVFKTIVVAQDVVDDLREASIEEDFGPQAESWIGKSEGKYVVVKRDHSARSDRHDLLATIISFVAKHATVVPCYKAIDYPAGELRRIQDVLSDGSVASVLVAAERNAPLYADDLVLATLARKEWGVRGFWTQPLLIKLFSIEQLEREEFFRSVTELVRRGYYFVRIDVAYLLWLINENGLKLSPEVLGGLALLKGPDCSIQSAVRVAADTMLACSQTGVPQHVRQMILDALLNALVSGRSSVIAIEAFLIELRRRMDRTSDAFREISTSINLWRKVYFKFQ